VSSVDAELTHRLAELRGNFDREFALPPRSTSVQTIGFLAIRLGAEPYAIRTAELIEVQVAPKLVALPGARREMVGLAGIRGRLVPVYDLAALVSHDEPEAKSWLAICGTDQPLGLTFDEVLGYIQAAPGDLYPTAEGERSGGHVPEVLRQDGATRMVVSISSIFATLRRGADNSTRGA
jgi:chemotaxis signal transduction protein